MLPIAIMHIVAVDFGPSGDSLANPFFNFCPGRYSPNARNHGAWYTTGSAEAIAQVDLDNDGYPEKYDVFPHTFTDMYFRISSGSNPQPSRKFILSACYCKHNEVFSFLDGLLLARRVG
jgi:hypothetical protein